MNIFYKNWFILSKVCWVLSEKINWNKDKKKKTKTKKENLNFFFLTWPHILDKSSKYSKILTKILGNV